MLFSGRSAFRWKMTCRTPAVLAPVLLQAGCSFHSGSSAAALYHRGQSEALRHHYGQAAASFLQARNLSGDPDQQAWAEYQLGCCYLAQPSGSKQGKRVLERLCRNYPQHFLAVRARADLDKLSGRKSVSLTPPPLDTDCGPQCLLYLMQHVFHKDGDLNKLRRLAGTTSHGTILLGLQRAARAEGLDPLADYNLMTYKSLHEPLDAWAMDELLGHLVNYRKQISPSMNELLPMEQFRLFGISTRFPEKLRHEAAHHEIKWEEIQPGVYEVRWGTHRVRILVLSEIPDARHNDVWELFSGVPEKVKLGAQRYRPRQENISGVIKDLFDRYQLEGMTMPYTLQDFTRDFVRRHLDELTPEERLERVPAEKRLEGVPVDERLEGLSLEEVLPRFPIEELEAYIRAHKERGDQPPEN